MEILTEKLELFLKSIDDVRPEVCDKHFQQFLYGFNVMLNGMFGEVDPTPEQVKIVNNWMERQITSQQTADKRRIKDEPKPDKPAGPSVDQMFTNLYGDFGL